jgi:hypothetical protein
MGSRPTGPKPVASASSATPARLEDTTVGQRGRVTDPHARNTESRQTEETSYERALEDEARRRHEAAERLKGDPLPEPDGESG